MSKDDAIQEIRAGLWSIFWDLNADELEPERAAQMISAFDSLIDVCRLEKELASGPQAAPDSVPDSTRRR